MERTAICCCGVAREGSRRTVARRRLPLLPVPAAIGQRVQRQRKLRPFPAHRR